MRIYCPGRHLRPLVSIAMLIYSATALADDKMAQRCIIGPPAESIQSCQAALANAPDDLLLRQRLAYGLLAAGAESESLDLYRELSLERPDDAAAQYDYGVTLIALHRYADGATVLARATALDPNNVNAHFASAIVFAELNLPLDAFNATLRAAELGSILAMYDLFLFYRDGYGIEPNQDESFRWLLTAAEHDHVAAMDRVVETYLNGGYGIRPDHKRAEKWAWRARKVRLGE